MSATAGEEVLNNPYHLQSDGLVARFNHMLTNMLASTAKENPFEWVSHLRKACLAYNTSVHATTGHIPFFLMFGRQAQLQGDLVFKTDKAPNMSSSEYALEIQQTFERAYDRVWQFVVLPVHMTEVLHLCIHVTNL